MSQDLGERLSRDLVIVLVGPQHPENVGGVARAMANFGLTRLVVVDPPPSYDPERARWMAPGAEDVLGGMRMVATLDEALEGVHHAVATTSRHRRLAPEIVEPDGMAEQFFHTEPGIVTAILFGREDIGLVNDEVLRCGSLLRIPTAAHASLNLAQSVLLVASRVFEIGRRHGVAAPGRPVIGRRTTTTTRELQRTDAEDLPADLSQSEPVVTLALSLLERVGYTRSTSPDRVSSTLRELLQRARPSRREVRALRGMVTRTQLTLERAGAVEPEAPALPDPPP